MEEAEVQERAEAFCAGLVAGDVERLTEDFSEALRQNLGEVLAILLLPSNEATVESIEPGAGSGYAVVLRLVAATEEVQIQTRWKDVDGRPTVVEVSHLSRTEIAAQTEAEAEGEGADDVEGADEETAG